MLEDLQTVVWKEWREYLPRSRQNRGPLTSLVLVVLIFGVFEPSRIGTTWLTSWPAYLVALIVPSAVVTAVVADSFAGERERHTLETLLASRLPDRAILAGKMAAAVAYGWGVSLLTLLLGAVTVIAKGSGDAHFYRADVLAGVVLLTLLMALLAVSSGVLISLRSATVRQAQQLISLTVIIPALLPTFALTALSTSQRRDLLDAVSKASLLEVALLVAAVLLVVDVALVAAAAARFRRSRLVLDTP